jgi:hypothetical protein
MQQISLMAHSSSNFMPTSVGSTTSSAGRQQAHQQRPAQSQPQEIDPIASAKILILKDLRKAIVVRIFSHILQLH